MSGWVKRVSLLVGTIAQLLPARRYDSAGTSYGPVSVSVWPVTLKMHDLKMTDKENYGSEKCNDGQKLRGLENAGLENDGQTFSKLWAELQDLENAGLENDGQGQTFGKLWAQLRGLENAGVQV